MGNIYLFNDYNSISSLNSSLSKCTGCQYGVHSKKVGGVGPPTCNLMIVGQHPGPKEVSSGIPFFGASGKMLKNIMKKVKLDPDSCYLTNAVKCKPMGEDKLTTFAIKACHHWLDMECDIVAPKLIVALGMVASDYLVGPDTKVGVEIKGRYGIPVVATYHTAYILRLKKAMENSVEVEETEGKPSFVKKRYDDIVKEVKAHWDLIQSIVKRCS